MAHKVKCVYCGKTFDRDAEAFIPVGARRYAHYACGTSENERVRKEQEDKEALEQYIMKLFKTTFIEPRIQKQIKTFKEEYNYTYSGMRRALEYFFEIKGNSIEKANGGIGIIPYIYKNAYNYYYALWQAQQKNEHKVVQEYIPQIKEIIIPAPERKIKTRKLFTFLDEEESK